MPAVVVSGSSAHDPLLSLPQLRSESALRQFQTFASFLLTPSSDRSRGQKKEGSCLSRSYRCLSVARAKLARGKQSGFQKVEEGVDAGLVRPLRRNLSLYPHGRRTKPQQHMLKRPVSEVSLSKKSRQYGNAESPPYGFAQDDGVIHGKTWPDSESLIPLVAVEVP